MKNKVISSKLCVLLAIIFFVNPVFATADALFSVISSNLVLSVSSESSDSIPCHDDMKVDTFIEQELSLSDSDSDCCADLCLCDDAGCHASSLISQFKSNITFNFKQNHFYHLPIYISLTFMPSSPPPIV